MNSKTGGHFLVTNSPLPIPRNSPLPVPRNARELADLSWLSRLETCAVAYNRDLRIIAWSKGSEIELGVPAEAVIGMPAYDSFPILVTSGAMKNVEATFDGQTMVSRHFFAVPKTDHWSFSQIFRRPLFNRSGDIAGSVAIIEKTIRLARFPLPGALEDQHPEANYDLGRTILSWALAASIALALINWSGNRMDSTVELLYGLDHLEEML